VTPDFEQLQLAKLYDGYDTITVSDGSGLQIDNIGSLSLQTSTAMLHLSQVLHCLVAIAKLLSINQFCKDNNCFFILTKSHYFIKDKQTG
jgi:copper homeostasis protein CutC